MKVVRQGGGATITVSDQELFWIIEALIDRRIEFRQHMKRLEERAATTGSEIPQGARQNMAILDDMTDTAKAAWGR